MVGTIPLSLTQQFDVYGKPLSGGQLYLMQAGTVSTPQDGFQDPGLTIKMPYPITLDAAGRIPQFYLADGSIKVRLQDKTGVVQLSADNLLVIGPSAGSGGGGSTVDPTQLIQTGNMILRYGVGAIAGYVRLNNLTIGSATSGATERANADCQALFLYLYGVDPSLVVSGGRGANAAADWAANKTIALPDWRGYAFSCLDDMGNAPAGRLSTSYFGSSPIVLGAVGGAESVVQTSAQMPLHFHSAAIYDPGHGHSVQLWSNNGVGGGSTFVNYTAAALSASGGSGNNPLNTSAVGTGVRVNSANGLDTTYSAGSGQGMRSLGPRKLCTAYLKL